MTKGAQTIAGMFIASLPLLLRIISLNVSRRPARARQDKGDASRHWPIAGFGQCPSATSTRDAPWYVVPDDKQNARLIVSRIILDTLEATQNRLSENERRAPAGIAVDPQTVAKSERRVRQHRKAQTAHHRPRSVSGCGGRKSPW